MVKILCDKVQKNLQPVKQPATCVFNEDGLDHFNNNSLKKTKKQELFHTLLNYFNPAEQRGLLQDEYLHHKGLTVKSKSSFI